MGDFFLRSVIIFWRCLERGAATLRVTPLTILSPIFLIFSLYSSRSITVIKIVSILLVKI